MQKFSVACKTVYEINPTRSCFLQTNIVKKILPDESWPQLHEEIGKCYFDTKSLKLLDHLPSPCQREPGSCQPSSGRDSERADIALHHHEALPQGLRDGRWVEVQD